MAHAVANRPHALARTAVALVVAVAAASPAATAAQRPSDTPRVTIVYTGRSTGALGAQRAQEDHELLTEQASAEGHPFKLVSHLAWRAPGIVVFLSSDEPKGDELPWIMAHRGDAEPIDSAHALLSANGLLLQDPWRPEPDLIAMLSRNPRRASEFPDLVDTRVRVSRLRTPDDHRVYIVEQRGAAWPIDERGWSVGEMNRVDVLDSRLFELPLNLGELGPRATLVRAATAAARARGAGVITVDLGHQEGDLALSGPDRARLDFTALDRLGYSVLVPYQFELSLGAATLVALTRAFPDITMLGANVRAAADSLLFTSGTVIDVAGTRVGLFGLVDPRVRDRLPRRVLSDFTFEPAATSARREVARLRALGATAIVALSNMDPVENATLGDAVPGIDAIVADLPVRWAPEGAAIRVELTDRPYARPGAPALIARSVANGLGVGQLDLEFRTTPGGTAPYLAALSHQLAIVSDRVPPDTALVREIAALGTVSRRPRGELMVPAFVDIADRHPALRTADAATRMGRMSKGMWEAFMARLLRARGSAEVAVIRRLEQFPPLIGKLHENEVEAWLRTEDRVVLVDVLGGDLRTLLKDDVRGELVASGIDAAAGTVQGHAIDDQTYYRVATTDVLFDGTRAGKFSRGRRVRRHFLPTNDGTLQPGRGGEPLALRDVVLGELKRIRARAHGEEQIDALAALIAPDPPFVNLFSVTFDRPTLWASANQVSTSGDYGLVPDSRATSRNAWIGGLGGRLVLTHERASTAADIGFTFAYARQGLMAGGREDVSTTANDIRIDITLRSSALTGARGQALPFVRATFNTEFTPTVDKATGLDNNHKLALRGSGGYLLMPGGAWRRAELALAVENDFGRPNLQYGLQALAHLEWRLGTVPGIASATGVKYRLRNEATWFLPAPKDNASHLALRANMIHELLIPLVDELSLVVSADLYFFQGKVESTYSPGLSTQIRIGITYDRLWKPRYQPFL